jgi:hypothetical protein
VYCTPPNRTLTPIYTATPTLHHSWGAQPTRNNNQQQHGD